MKQWSGPADLTRETHDFAIVESADEFRDVGCFRALLTWLGAMSIRPRGSNSGHASSAGSTESHVTKNTARRGGSRCRGNRVSHSGGRIR
jgi:hypothetical protein